LVSGEPWPVSGELWLVSGEPWPVSGELWLVSEEPWLASREVRSVGKQGSAILRVSCFVCWVHEENLRAMREKECLWPAAPIALENSVGPVAVREKSCEVPVGSGARSPKDHRKPIRRLEPR